MTKLTISEKDAFVANQDTGWDINIIYPEGWSYEKRSDYHHKKRLAFVDKCRKFGMSFQEIGDLLRVSKQAAYIIYTYGSHGFNNSKKKAIKTRDRFKCRICKARKLAKGGLHVHHIDGNGRNNKDSNLASLCPKCHKELHLSLRKIEKSYTQLAN